MPGAARSLAAGEILASVGNGPGWCWIVISGVIEKAILDRDGTRQILGFYFRDDVCRSQPGAEPPDYEVVATTDATVARLHVADVRRLSDASQAVRTAFEEAASTELAAAHRWIAHLGKSAGRRVAALLQDIFVRLEAADMPMVVFGTQTTIAQATGLSLVHVHRSLKVLASQGCLGRDGRRIVLGDADLLEAFAACDPPRRPSPRWRIFWSTLPERSRRRADTNS